MATCNHWICYRLVMLCFLVQQNNLRQFINEPRLFWERKKDTILKLKMMHEFNIKCILNVESNGFWLGEGVGRVVGRHQNISMFLSSSAYEIQVLFWWSCEGDCLFCEFSHALWTLVSFFFLILNQFYLFFHAFITEIFIN